MAQHMRIHILAGPEPGLNKPRKWTRSLARELMNRGHSVGVFTDQYYLPEGLMKGNGVLLVADYGHIIPEYKIVNYEHAFCIHRADPATYKGASPVSRHLLWDSKEITVTLMLMSPEVDSGPVVRKHTIGIEPHWLFEDLDKATRALYKTMFLGAIDKLEEGRGLWVTSQDPYTGIKYYRRKPEESEIFISNRQWLTLRASDNQRWPAFFKRHGHKYRIKIERVE